MAKRKKMGAATQVGLRQAAINKKNLKGKAPEVAPMIDLGGDQVDIGFNANTIEDPMLMRHLKGVPKQPSIEDIIEEIGDNFEYIELLANATPYGMMVPYSLPTEPVDWVFCNGQVCPESPLRDQLIAAGNPFGESGGLPTVPNLSGRTIVGNTGMGNVQQPALDQTATELNKTLGTTSGLFTIKSDVAPQREFNIGTTDNGGLLTITTDKIATGIEKANGNTANITNPGGTANHTDNATTGISMDDSLVDAHVGGTGGATANISSNDGGGANVTNLSGTGLTGVNGGGNHNHGVNNLKFASKGNALNHGGQTLQPYGSGNNWQTPGPSKQPGKGDGSATGRDWLSQRDYGFNLLQLSPGHNLNSEMSVQQWIDAGYVGVNSQVFAILGRGNNNMMTTSEPDHGHTITDVNHRHAIVQTDHSHTLPDVKHKHTINDAGHTHNITQTNHEHTITDPTHNHVAHATGTIPGSDFEFDLTQPGLVVNFIIFHGQHLPEDTEPVVRQDEFAPVAEEVKELKELVANLEAQINV